MATIYFDKDVDPSVIRGKRIAVIGYGSQGHAHALNLRDSGLDVRIGLPASSKSRSRAVEAGFRVVTVAEAASEADLVMMLAPDQKQRAIYEEGIAAQLEKGKALFFCHGFNIHYKQIKPPPGVDVVMVAPKAIGPMVRRHYEEKRSLPALIAVHQDATGRARALGLAYAGALGAGKAGIIETTFQEETETDLFGEQAVLCGGATALVKAGFEVLVEAGYQPENAYFECLHELKLVVDLMYEVGISGMRGAISDTAEYGDYTRGPRVLTEGTKEAMRQILKEVQSGAFAEEFLAESREGGRALGQMRERSEAHPIEEVGRRLRKMMFGRKGDEEGTQ
jgi:ketol-acid reductoisomerase